MRRWALTFLLAAAPCFAGCMVVADQPLWSENVIARDVNLAGNYIVYSHEFKNFRATSELSPATMHTRLIERSRGTFSLQTLDKKFGSSVSDDSLVLVRLGGSLYLDQYRPVPQGSKEMEVHIFTKVVKRNNSLELYMIDPLKLANALHNGAAIAVEGDWRWPVIRSKTTQLQRFLLNYGSDIFMDQPAAEYHDRQDGHL